MKKTLATAALLAGLVTASAASACDFTSEKDCFNAFQASGETTTTAQNSVTTAGVKLGAVDGSHGSAATIASAGKIFPGQVPLSLTAEAWQMSGGRNALAGVATGSVRLGGNAMLDLGGGVVRVEQNEWETAPLARVGVAHVSDGVKLGLEYSRVFLNNSDDMNVTTAGVSLLF